MLLIQYIDCEKFLRAEASTQPNCNEDQEKQ